MDVDIKQKKWEEVVKYYTSLRTNKKREEFFVSLHPAQQEYLYTLLHQNSDYTHYSKDRKEDIQLLPKSQSRKQNIKVFNSLSIVRDIVKKISYSYRSTFATIRLPKVRIPHFESIIGKKTLSIICLCMMCLLVGLTVFSFANTSLTKGRQGSVKGENSEYDIEKLRAEFFEMYPTIGGETDDDKDGLTSFDEFLIGSDMSKSDTNENGIIDGYEVLLSNHPRQGGTIDSKDNEMTQTILTNSKKREIYIRILGYGFEKFLEEDTYASIERADTLLINAFEQLELEPIPAIDSTKPLFMSINQYDVEREEVFSRQQDSSIFDMLNSATITRLDDENQTIGNNHTSVIFAHHRDTNSSLSLSKKLHSFAPGTKIQIEALTTDSYIVTLEYIVTKNNLYAIDQIPYSSQRRFSELMVITPFTSDNYQKSVVIFARLTSVQIIT